MRFLMFLILCLGFTSVRAQVTFRGSISGNLMDEQFKALEGASVRLSPINDSTQLVTGQTSNNGGFEFPDLVPGYYRLKFSYTGLQNLVIDSILIKEEKKDILLNDLVLHPATAALLDEVVIYVEKPLIQTKDGNITFNASESPLSAGSSASELLETVPLVSKDASGNILVRGKEPRILIDDKPVELNLQQLQDLLESMPGSSIEKIEVMTNPPPQFANEQGGVINIITRKGTVGINGRINLTYGTRTQGAINGSFNYRKQGLNISVQGGVAYNEFFGNGYSKRQNIFKDSVNFFNTENDHINENLRPNFRASVQYDINKYHALNLVVNYNHHVFDNQNNIDNININRFSEIFRLRNRLINSTGNSLNPSLNFSYTFKTKKSGETLRFFTNINYSHSSNDRLFYESYLNPDYSFSGKDSTQKLLNENRTWGKNFRVQYDLLLKNKKTSVSLGSFINHSRSHIEADAYFLTGFTGKWTALDALTNELVFKQEVKNLRGSLKHLINEKLSITGGMAAEQTKIHFDLVKAAADTGNTYWSYLPFATLNKNWNGVWNLSMAYRKTIRRPGIGQLNPTVDFSDPFNLRFGNPGLQPSYAHNYDLVFGRNKNDLFFNIGMGYNLVQDIFNSIRTRISADTTQTTWQNISNKKEYELSAWSGYKISKALRINVSASYVYNVYGAYDKEVRKFRDGGSLTSNINTSYTFNDLYSATGNFTYNRFANPQGNARTNLSMNLGVQAKFFDKKLVLTLNSIDPFIQQRNHSFTYGTNFISENFNETRSRNFRISVAYVFRKTTQATPKAAKEKLKSLMGKGS